MVEPKATRNTAMSRQVQDAVKDTLREKLGKVVDQALEEQVEEALDNRPGTIHRGVKKQWTRSQLEAEYPNVTFTPEENLPVIINGVEYYLFAGVDATVPCAVKTAYDERRRALRAVGRGVMTSFGFVRPTGEGGLPPEG